METTLIQASLNNCLLYPSDTTTELRFEVHQRFKYPAKLSHNIFATAEGLIALRGIWRIQICRLYTYGLH